MELLERQVDNKGMSKVARRHAVELFEDLQNNYGDLIPKYDGELYLEKHQGTYTSQALNKLFNRLLEQSLHTLEWQSPKSRGWTINGISWTRCGKRCFYISSTI